MSIEKMKDLMKDLMKEYNKENTLQYPDLENKMKDLIDNLTKVLDSNNYNNKDIIDLMKFCDSMSYDDITNLIMGYYNCPIDEKYKDVEEVFMEEECLDEIIESGGFDRDPDIIDKIIDYNNTDDFIDVVSELNTLPIDNKYENKEMIIDVERENGKLKEDIEY